MLTRTRALRQRVEQLLAADQQAGGVLDRDDDDGLVLGPPSSSDEPAAPEAPGTVVGRYKLKEQIGEGGFGLVFVAEQYEPVRRKVALKVVKPGMDTREVVARFEAERQALALMDHPNIAQVLDGGATDSGRPYFVMELVRGVAITEYCDRNQLTTRERLELFVSVCRAVQHAHQKGIIHRDLKPSNVLVTLHDSNPVVKVIDFGVAKALNQQLSEHSVYTRFAQMVGTPTYMSPEQAELSGLDIDTRADIYSLGVLLYELLTGTTPFDKERLKTAGFDEIRRIIREEEPPRPSTRISTLGQAASTVSANRKSDPRRLSRSLRGELDWIVMKCLEKDRTRRYETAADLSRDIERYLKDEPVEASPPSAVYRLRKVLRRNRGPVLAAAAIFLLLVGGIVGTTVGLVRAEARAEGERRAKVEAEHSAGAEREARVAAQEAEHAARESEADTRAFSEFLVNDVLIVPRPVGTTGGRGVDITMRHALIAAQGRIGVTFQGRPRAEAVARHDLGVTFRVIGEPRLAEPHLRRAVALRQQALGPDHPDTLASQNSLGVLLNALGKHAEALPLLDDALQRCRSTLGPDAPLTLVSLDNLAAGYRYAGDYERAIALHQDALERRTATLGSDQVQTLATMDNLAQAYLAAGRPGLAIPLYQEALRRAEAQLRPDDPFILTSLNNLGASYYRDQKVDLALPLFKKAFARQKEALGTDHPNTINTMGNIASCHRAAGHLDLAVPLYEAALKLQRAKLNADHPDTLLSAYNLALAYQEQGKTDAAVPLFEEAAAGAERGGFTHEFAGRMVVSLINCHERHGRYAQAEIWRRKWLPVVRNAMGPDSVSYSVELGFLGANLLAQKKFADAEPVLRESLRIREAQRPGAWFTFSAQSLLGAALAGQQKYADAEPLLLDGYRGMRRTEAEIPPEVRHERLRSALERLIHLYDGWGKPAEAAKWRRELESLPKH